MSTRQEIAQETAAALAAADLSRFPALLGFDGFVDDILHVVDKRQSQNRFDRLPTLDGFARRIAAAAGQSSNMELVRMQQKLGGNGPIMGSALASLGLPVTYIGAVADPSDPAGIHPVFQDFRQHATLIPLTPPAHTHALEFTDGKLMLGELSPLSQITWQRIRETLGAPQLTSLCERAALLGLMNWTMLPHLTDIWQHFAVEVLPKLSRSPRQMFIDLADPQKRDRADLLSALSVLRQLNSHVPVILGLNLSEARQVGEAMGIATMPDTPLAQIAQELRARIDVAIVVIHPTDRAAAADAQGSAEFPGPFVRSPKISTGAGDHFNAGFAVGMLLNLDLDHALCLGVVTSGYYVRHAASPSREHLVQFLRNLPAPDLVG